MKKDLPADFLIFPLDVEGLAAAREWVGRLKGVVGIFKIGLELFLREGPKAVEMVQAAGAKVFLDLKLHDIPRTVERAAEEVGRMGVFMFTVHGAGGGEMIKAATAGAKRGSEKEGGREPLTVAVTVLTSLGEKAVREIGFSAGVQETVLRLAEVAKRAGAAGVVASAQEAAAIRSLTGPSFKIVCPGIRPPGASPGDQARLAAPGEARRAGADYLVVGRPIREAVDPIAAALEVIKEFSLDKE